MKYDFNIGRGREKIHSAQFWKKFILMLYILQKMRISSIMFRAGVSTAVKAVMNDH